MILSSSNFCWNFMLLKHPNVTVWWILKNVSVMLNLVKCVQHFQAYSIFVEFVEFLPRLACHFWDVGFSVTSVTLGFTARMWHWDFCHACGTGISASRTAWLTSVSPRDVHSSAFSICVLYRSILAQQREFFEHPILRPLLLSSTRLDPTCLAFSSVRLTRYSSVGSLRLSWCVFVVLWCAVLRCVVFCCVLLFCCSVVLLCFVVLCCAVPCFTSWSRIAHCSK